MKQNVFYLDESGGFSGNKKKQDLVGGFFSTSEISNEIIKDFFEKAGYEKFHGMEIDDNDKFSRVLDLVIEFCMVKNIEPVLFISTRGFHIVDDSTTYLHVITDGIMKWIVKNLCYVERFSDIHLVIERRTNTNESQYKNKLKERFEKEAYFNQQLKKVPAFNFELGSKNTPCLWLSDAIVHGYYRRKDLNQATRERFEKWIHPYSLYVYRETIRDRIWDYFNDENILQGLVRFTVEYTYNPEEYKALVVEIMERLILYPVYSLSAIMEQLTAFFMDRIHTFRNLDTVAYVETWKERLLPMLQDRLESSEQGVSSDLDWCYLRLYEIMVTAYNHSGAIEKAEKVFREIEGMKTLQLDLSTYQSWARLQVLRGVHLTNMYCYDETIRLMERLNDTIGEALTLLDDPEKNITVKPSLVGEIKGTMLQAMMYRSAETKEGWENIRELSDDLFETFPLQQDRNRQLQYRSQLEAYADEMDKAREYLAKAMGMEYDNDEALCGKVLERGNSFELLHFLRIWYMEIARGRVPGKEYYDTWNALREKFSQNYENIMQKKTYPVHTILRYLMVLYYAAGTGGAIEKAEEYYKRAVELCHRDGEHVTLLTLTIGIMADRASMLKRAGKGKEAGKARDDLLTKAETIHEQVKDTPVATHVRSSIEAYKNTAVEKWPGTLWHLYPQ